MRNMKGVLTTEHFHEMRGIPRIRFIEYFAEIGNLMEDGRFGADGWEVVIGPEDKVNFGRIFLPKVNIIFRTDDEDCYQQLLHGFRLRFLSAGG